VTLRRVELVSREDGQRLDRFLAEHLDDISRSEVQRQIQAGSATVNGQTAKPSQRLGRGDVVCMTLADPEPLGIEPWEVPLAVVYEDPDCVVVDKPAGMVVHPATSHKQHTLVNALLAHYPEVAAMLEPTTDRGRRPGIVHRLDKDTSGLIVVARHEAARRALQRQFKARMVEKRYLALLHGRLAPPQGVVRASIGRDPRRRKRMTVSPDGRPAVSEYTSRRFLFLPHREHELYTLVEAHPLTGRTHQLRVHFAHVGHPIVGDAVYGPRKRRLPCPRQFLHACYLGFALPSSGERVGFSSELPDDLAQVLSMLQEVV
jgi:23S rRNA pseudouridine1911/1915/1917 synthase